MPLKHPLRNLFHLILGGFFIFLIWAAQARSILVFWLFIFLASSILFEILRLKIKIINHWIFKIFPFVFKQSEHGRVSGLTHFLAAILITYLIFPLQISLLAIAFLTFGDLAAVVIGQLFGRRKINLQLAKNKKTWAGTLGCFLISFFSGYLLIKFLQIDVSAAIIGIGALTAALAELFFNYPDDNYTIPIISGGVMGLLLLIF